MRKLASIVTISTSEPIPETEKLDVTMMNGKGWRVVTGREEFKPGDTAVYFEIDSALPVDDERYAFLHERCLKRWRDKRNNVLGECVRIRTIKLRGVISQGLIMPIAKFPELEGKEEGTDVTADLRVQHYDELADAIAEQMAKAYNPNGKGRREGNFPSWIPKTDEERCVTADTLVTLGFGGSKCIKDVEVYTEVEAYDVDADALSLQKVQDKLVSKSTPQDEWYRLETETGHSVCITGNSRVWLPEFKCYRRVDQLRPGDKLLVKD